MENTKNTLNSQKAEAERLAKESQNNQKAITARKNAKRIQQNAKKDLNAAQKKEATAQENAKIKRRKFPTLQVSQDKSDSLTTQLNEVEQKSTQLTQDLENTKNTLNSQKAEAERLAKESQNNQKAITARNNAKSIQQNAKKGLNAAQKKEATAQENAKIKRRKFSTLQVSQDKSDSLTTQLNEVEPKINAINTRLGKHKEYT